MKHLLQDQNKNNIRKISNKKSILFVCHHLSSLYQFVLLSLTRYKKDKVVLLVYNDLFCNSDFAKKLKEKKVFDRILSIKEPKNFQEKQNEQFVIDYYDAYFIKHSLTFDDISEIYSSCDLNNLFPVYSTLNNRAISYIEMYEGQFNDVTRYNFCTSVFEYPTWVEYLYKKYHTLSGCGDDFTYKRYLYPGSVCEYPDKDVHIDFLKDFYNLPEALKKIIVECMTIPKKIIFSEINLLLLNSPKWTKSIIGLEEPYHYVPYLLIADYYLEKFNLFLKDHPHAENNQYFTNNIASFANIIPTTIPIEFYGLIDNFHIKRLISVASSGNKKITQFIAEEIHLGENFLKEYQYLHKCYLALSIAHQLEQDFIFQGIGISNNFIENLNHCAFSEGSKIHSIFDNEISDEGYFYQILCEGPDYIYTDSVHLFDKKRITIFFDTKTLSDNLDKIQEYGYSKNLIAVKIDKTIISNHSLADTQRETMFFFCTDNEYISKIKNKVWYYDLCHTGIRITAKMLNYDITLID